jgi:hypothetical protein
VWVADLSTGHSEPALPGVEIGGPLSLSPDGKAVAFFDRDRAPWLASLDHRTPPRKLSSKKVQSVQVMSSGNVYYSVVEGSESQLYRMQPGGGETRILAYDASVRPRNVTSISPDEKWVAYVLAQRLQAVPMGGGSPTELCRDCYVTWGADGRSMLFHFFALMGEKNASVQVPCQPGALPALPAAGVSWLEEAAALPGARVILSDSAAAATGSVYAYVQASRHSNIFRITLP